jgi:putative ATP-binding cassette transporter
LSDNPKAPDRKDGTQTGAGPLRSLFGFLLRESDVLRSPVMLFVVLASGSRTALIYLVNETAERGGATLWLFAALVGAAGLMLYSTHQARMSGVALTEELVRKLRAETSERLISADVDFFQSRDLSQIHHLITNQVSTIATATMRFVDAAQAVLLLIFVLGYMMLEMPASVLATVLALGLGLAAFAINEGPATRAVRQTHTAVSDFHHMLTDLTRGYKELRLRRSRRQDLGEEIEGQVSEVKRLALVSERHYSFGNVSASGALAVLLIALVVLLPMLTGADSVTLLQIITLVLFSFAPLESMISGLPLIARAGVAFGVYEDFSATLDANAERPDPALGDQRSGFERIELRGVTAHLTRDVGKDAKARDSFTLGPIDLVLRPGESVFITGGNGMGKSTLLSLLTGLRHPDGGEILIDGAPVTRDTVSDYRSVFSAVFSEFYMFRKLYGLSTDERTRLLAHVDEMGLSQGVAVKDGGFANLALSTGQMRRLALSIALAELRPVIVLDEFAADQDPGRRRFFYDTLVPRLAAQGHCVVAVTHDEHMFDRADRLIRMEDGKIVSDTRQRAEATGHG